MDDDVCAVLEVLLGLCARSLNPDGAGLVEPIVQRALGQYHWLHIHLPKDCI